ncbi:GTP-binding protein Obg/CgtA [Exidia glandulosa HHB12029]|uniref:GTP-binding protein Obg/CgtA n=1 Tax=Exidia glandulosa HHB12029 TaxID=1314781 RepID=A0A165K9U7_EXIGL|nr:GTP-binding protein Obg/CgtA [Exidia glandulosa HHB12029]
MLATARHQRLNAALWAFVRSPSTRSYETARVSIVGSDAPVRTVEEEDNETRRRKKTEWKRRQNRQSFKDHLLVKVKGGRGGDGCVAFHRDALIAMGPPSGGNGGKGGDVYIRAVEGLTTLSNIPTRVHAEKGDHGKGNWGHGKRGADRIIDVPVGTIIREVTDERRPKDFWEEEWERVSAMDKEEGMREVRQRRWVHFPQTEDRNLGRSAFQDSERMFRQTERKIRWAKRQQRMNPIILDLDKPSEGNGVLVAEGGIGGYGNPYFVQTKLRSPHFATRGFDGDRLLFELELKLVADIGLVGFPNAGKSTLLRALTNSKAEVASYAFTTLNPQIGIVKVWEDGSFEGRQEGDIIEDSKIERVRERAAMVSGEDAPPKPPDRPHLKEVSRFTIADNPGLVEHASDNVGLGHSFLKAIERCHALVYVVDLSGPAPWDELQVLESELEAYKSGLSRVARLVIANKADLLDAEDDAEVAAARAKLEKLEEFVREFMNVGGAPLDVVPTSAKHSMNLRKVVDLMQSYLEEAAEDANEEPYSDSWE